MKKKNRLAFFEAQGFGVPEFDAVCAQTANEKWATIQEHMAQRDAELTDIKKQIREATHERNTLRKRVQTERDIVVEDLQALDALDKHVTELQLAHSALEDHWKRHFLIPAYRLTAMDRRVINGQMAIELRKQQQALEEEQRTGSRPGTDTRKTPGDHSITFPPTREGHFRGGSRGGNGDGCVTPQSPDPQLEESSTAEPIPQTAPPTAQTSVNRQGTSNRNSHTPIPLEPSKKNRTEKNKKPPHRLPEMTQMTEGGTPSPVGAMITPTITAPEILEINHKALRALSDNRIRDARSNLVGALTKLMNYEFVDIDLQQQHNPQQGDLTMTSTISSSQGMLLQQQHQSVLAPSKEELFQLTHNNLACVALKSKRPQSALNHLEHVLKPNTPMGEDPTALLNLCTILSEVGKYGEAILAARKAVVLLQRLLCDVLSADVDDDGNGSEVEGRIVAGGAANPNAHHLPKVEQYISALYNLGTCQLHIRHEEIKRFCNESSMVANSLVTTTQSVSSKGFDRVMEASEGQHALETLQVAHAMSKKLLGSVHPLSVKTGTSLVHASRLSEGLNSTLSMTNKMNSQRSFHQSVKRSGTSMSLRK